MSVATEEPMASRRRKRLRFAAAAVVFGLWVITLAVLAVVSGDKPVAHPRGPAAAAAPEEIPGR